MVSNIVSLLSKAFMPPSVQSSAQVTRVGGSNPFANPFVNTQGVSKQAIYAKNNPVQGGYFAGYYNGKANIVGQRLFLEV